MGTTNKANKRKLIQRQTEKLKAGQRPQRCAGAGTRACAPSSVRGSRPRCSISQPCTCKQDRCRNKSYTDSSQSRQLASLASLTHSLQRSRSVVLPQPSAAHSLTSAVAPAADVSAVEADPAAVSGASACCGALLLLGTFGCCLPVCCRSSSSSSCAACSCF